MNQQGRRDDNWIVLMRVRLEPTAHLIEGLLNAAGIEAEVIDKTASEMPMPAVESMSGLEIWVPEASAAQARRLLNDAREGTTRCASCGHMSTQGEATCEHCGATM
ncbi:MAG: DUF2007 domain-containing protein [Candidatus Polarisedimenticolia bacterium]